MPKKKPQGARWYFTLILCTVIGFAGGYASDYHRHILAMADIQVCGNPQAVVILTPDTRLRIIRNSDVTEELKRELIMWGDKAFAKGMYKTLEIMEGCLEDATPST